MMHGSTSDNLRIRRKLAPSDKGNEHHHGVVYLVVRNENPFQDGRPKEYSHLAIIYQSTLTPYVTMSHVPVDTPTIISPDTPLEVLLEHQGFHVGSAQRWTHGAW